MSYMNWCLSSSTLVERWGFDTKLAEVNLPLRPVMHLVIDLIEEARQVGLGGPAEKVVGFDLHELLGGQLLPVAANGPKGLVPGIQQSGFVRNLSVPGAPQPNEPAWSGFGEGADKAMHPRSSDSAHPK